MTDEGWRTVSVIFKWVVGGGFVVWAVHDYAAKAGIIHSLVDEGIRLFQGMKR